MKGGRRISGITLLVGLTTAAPAFGQSPTTAVETAAVETAVEPPAESENEPGKASSADEAAAAFQRAEEAFAQGNFGDAARAFDLANRLAPHASAVFNSAVAWDHAGDSPRAATNYARALSREGLTAEQTDQAEKRLVELGERLARVHFSKPINTTLSVAHLQNEPIPTRFFLEPGNYELTLEKGPLRRVEQISVARGKNAQFALKPLVPPTRSIPPAPPPKERTEELPSATQEVSGWVLLGVGIVAAGAAVYMGQEAVRARNQFVNSGKQDRQTHDRSFNLRLGSNVATAGASIVGATGLVLLLTAPTVHF